MAAADEIEPVLDWIRREGYYTRSKFTPESETVRTRTMEFDEGDQWKFFLDQYYKRAKVLGLNTPNGRQALAKFVSTAAAMLNNVINEYGELPEPGWASGDIHEDVK